MTKGLLFLLVSFSFTVKAYVPTVESLFRHGSNPDLTANTVSVTLKVTRSSPFTEESAVEEKKEEEIYRLFFTKTAGESIKVAQTQYTNTSFSESSLVHKIYYPNFSAFTFGTAPENIERGLFFGIIRSVLLNEGFPLINYLKALGAPVKLNAELINRDKVELLAAYKRYLIATNRDRRKNENNPLRPEDPTEKARVEKVMAESMYVDTKQVRLSRENSEMAWLVSAGPFEAAVSYRKRHPQRIKFKTGAGEFEVVLSDYWLANGIHYLPKIITVRSLSGELFKVEISNLRHFTEKDEDLIRRLQKWDQILKGREASLPRPQFLL